MGVVAVFAASFLGLLVSLDARLVAGRPPAGRGHPQADEAEVTGGGTSSSSMWAAYASETTVYRN